MFYLVVDSKGEKLIVQESEADLFTNDMSVQCLSDKHFKGKALMVRQLKVTCDDRKREIMTAFVYFRSLEKDLNL